MQTIKFESRHRRWEARRKAIKASSRIILCYMQKKFIVLQPTRAEENEEKKQQTNGKTEVQPKLRERKYLLRKWKNGMKKGKQS